MNSAEPEYIPMKRVSCVSELRRPGSDTHDTRIFPMQTSFHAPRGAQAAPLT